MDSTNITKKLLPAASDQQTQFLLPVSSFIIYSSTLKMETAGSSETLVPIFQITFYHIPEEYNLQAVSKINPFF